jgi:hypothetical protein
MKTRTIKERCSERSQRWKLQTIMHKPLCDLIIDVSNKQCLFICSDFRQWMYGYVQSAKTVTKVSGNAWNVCSITGVPSSNGHNSRMKAMKCFLGNLEHLLAPTISILNLTHIVKLIKARWWTLVFPSKILMLIRVEAHMSHMLAIDNITILISMLISFFIILGTTVNLSCRKGRWGY